MKRAILFFLLIFLAYTAFSQDLIVTTDNDSVNCKISKIDDTYIYFSFKKDNDIRSTLIPKVKVNTHLYNYYSYSEIPEVKYVIPKNYPVFRLSFGGGFSYRTAEISSDISNEFIDYMKKLKLGYNFYMDVAGYFNRAIGLGASCKWFKSSNSIVDGIYIIDTAGNLRSGTMSDNINILFVGPMFSVRFLNKAKRHALHLNASIGFMGYWDDAILVEPFQIHAKTAGLSLEVGYDIRITDNLLVGFQFSSILGAFRSYKLTTGGYSSSEILPERQAESISRIDLTIGLRFSKLPLNFESVVY